MKTSLKRNTKAYSNRGSYGAYGIYNTLCFFPPLILNPSILLVASLNQDFHCESCRGEVLALITECKSVKK